MSQIAALLRASQSTPAGGVQPVASMVTINTQLITSATRRLRLQLPGGATVTAIHRPGLDKLATLSLAAPAGTSIPAGAAAAAAAAGAPGMPTIWAGEVVGQRGGVSSVTLLVADNGGVYGNIRYLDRKSNAIRTFRVSVCMSWRVPCNWQGSQCIAIASMRGATSCSRVD